jgi:hypothetical protein
MIDFHYWPTPNGWKISIMLEESGLPYRMVPVNIGAGDQFRPAFLAISPNNRMPAIVDHDSPGGPLPIFESGPILLPPGAAQRPLPAAGCEGPQGMPGMAVLAGWQPGADGRATQPFRELRAGRARVFAHPLRQ